MCGRNVLVLIGWGLGSCLLCRLAGIHKSCYQCKGLEDGHLWIKISLCGETLFYAVLVDKMGCKIIHIDTQCSRFITFVVWYYCSVLYYPINQAFLLLKILLQTCLQSRSEICRYNMYINTLPYLSSWIKKHLKNEKLTYWFEVQISISCVAVWSIVQVVLKLPVLQ